MGGLGGRVDQAFSQIHHLAAMRNKRFYRKEKKEKEDVHTSLIESYNDKKQDESSSSSSQYLTMNLYLISEESITFILSPGNNIIYTPGRGDTHPSYLSENVGIIPILGPTNITIHGFEWDVVNWSTEIGGQVSTSNHIRADVVSVKAPDSVLFTLELASRLKRRK